MTDLSKVINGVSESTKRLIAQGAQRLGQGVDMGSRAAIQAVEKQKLMDIGVPPVSDVSPDMSDMQFNLRATEVPSKLSPSNAINWVKANWVMILLVVLVLLAAWRGYVWYQAKKAREQGSVQEVDDSREHEQADW